LHVIERFQIPEWWPRILSIDWGKRAMCYAMWGAIAPNHKVYIYRERAWYGRDIPYWASEIREIHNENNEQPVHTVLCGSAWQSRGGELICDEFQKYSDLVPTSSENTPGSRVAGLQLIHDFLRWEKKTVLKAKNEFYDMLAAQEIYRNYGPVALENYKKQFYDEPEEDNLPILQIFENCKILIDTIPMCIYKSDGNVEDIEEFDGDDPIDCIRYFCRGVRKYILGEIGNMNLLEKKQIILSDYGVDNDTTRMYRRLEAIEMHDQHTLQDCIPVSRRSRFNRRFH
jgi:hypothetical protein